jgi:cytoskeletal protein RodZ
MTKLGQHIQNKRIEHGLTIEDVSHKLKIKKQYVQSIENDEVGCFNSQAYYYGYLKQYLKLLNMQNIDFSTSEIEKKQPLSLDIPKINKVNPGLTLTVITISCAMVIYYICNFFISK